MFNNKSILMTGGISYGKIQATLLTRCKPRRAVIYSRDELLLGLTPFCTAIGPTFSLLMVRGQMAVYDRYHERVAENTIIRQGAGYV